MRYYNVGGDKMRYLYIVCAVIKDELCSFLHKKENDNIVWELPLQLHEQPVLLRQELVKQLKKADHLASSTEDPQKGIDAIVLVIGLCGGALDGLETGRHPVYIPRAHDCVTLFLGSKERYNDLFNKYNGSAYWFTPAFVRQGCLPTKEYYEEMRKTYSEHYDEENAQYLVDVEIDTLKNYKILSRVDTLQSPNMDLVRICAECSRDNAWKIESHNINPQLFKDMAEGSFSKNDFLTVPPHGKIKQTHDSRVIDIL